MTTPQSTEHKKTELTNETPVPLNPDFADIRILVQPTPNPSAYKFIVLSHRVKSKGTVTYNSDQDCFDNELARSLFKVKGVKQLYFFDNMITVSFEKAMDLVEGEEQVIATIKEELPAHNPDFNTERPASETAAFQNEDMIKIDKILSRTIRPALQGDGGDLELISYKEKEKELYIRYQGACGNCPSATMGTLMAIEGILQDEFDEGITVIPA